MCPKCGSGFLMIKHKTVAERFMIAMTDKRKYCCRDCGTYFRAPDRRKRRREVPGSDALAAGPGLQNR